MCLKEAVSVTYASDGCVGDLSANSHDEENPRLGILQGLQELIFLEMTVLHTLPVTRDTRHGNQALLLSQELRGRREIREDQERQNASNDGEGAEDQEDVHPLRETGGDVADSVADQTASC